MTGLPVALRVAAVAGLVGTALFSQPMLVRAETTPIPTVRLVQATPVATPAQTKAAAGATEAKVETVEQRITNLHTALKITSDEEANWKGVAVAMRENASAMEKLMADKAKRDPQTMTAVDDLKTYQMFAQTHVDGLKNLTAAFDTLYRAMPAAQQKIADSVFQNTGRGRRASNG
jgi:L-lactate utilization protein LutC